MNQLVITMKSISVHQLDEELARKLEQRAEEQNQSLNRTIKQLLRQALGLERTKKNGVDFSDLCGVWSKDELLQFESQTAELNEVRREDWQ
jgi:plasmid stability protein